MGMIHAFVTGNNKCQRPGDKCDNSREAMSRYCVDHTCKERECYTMAGTGGYCKLHTCAQEGCDGRTVSGSTMCRSHGPSRGFIETMAARLKAF